MEFTVHVGWTSTRPVRPDEHWSSVTVLAADAVQAALIAAQMVMCRPQCVMPTTTLVVV